MASVVYAAGILLYVWARREQRLRVFQPAEAVTCVVLVIAAVVGIVLISTGHLTL
jgi:arginine:ornithine antiporter/lysine permease